MFPKLKFILSSFSTELRTYRLVLQDKRTPRVAKWLLGLAIAYFLSPIDLIPDFIPVLGQLDDLLIVSVLIKLALKMVPLEVLTECRRVASST